LTKRLKFGEEAAVEEVRGMVTWRHGEGMVVDKGASGGICRDVFGEKIESVARFWKRVGMEWGLGRTGSVVAPVGDSFGDSLGNDIYKRIG